MAVPDAITGEPSIIAQLNRQDAQQRVNVNKDVVDNLNRSSIDEARNPSKADQLFGAGRNEIAGTSARGDGLDREPDSDTDDGGSVTDTRGQNVNIVA